MSVAITGVISCKKIEESAVEDEEIEMHYDEDEGFELADKQ